VRLASVVIAASFLPVAAAAGELEITGHIGPTFPFYEQEFAFDPGSLPSIPGITVTQEDIFRLDAHGGLALGLSASYQFTPWLGIEARVDTADVGVNIQGARYQIRTDLPSPLPDLVSELDLSSGEANLHRIHPFSLNLRARSEGRTRVGASAGISYLPSFSFVIEQDATLRIVEPLPVNVGTAHLAVAAEALPGEEDQGRLGVNAGAFVQFGLTDHVSLQADARYFHFQEQTLSWGLPQVAGGLPLVEETIVKAIASRLEPVEFNPTFFQLTAGVTLRF